MGSGAVYEKSYLGSVVAMNMNASYAAVLFDAKIQLHTVSSPCHNGRWKQTLSFDHVDIQIDPNGDVRDDFVSAVI